MIGYSVERMRWVFLALFLFRLFFVSIQLFLVLMLTFFIFLC